MDYHPKFNDSECSIIFGTPAVTHLLLRIIFVTDNIHLTNAVPCRAEILNARRAVYISSLAHKTLEKRIKNFEQDRWRDMGVVMLTFEVHEGLDGALVVDRSVYCFQRLPSWLPVLGCRQRLPD
jgi:hypothetical protein